ncbi:MAG: haloacid dehalogenase-like hydrolase, partial [Candidatus Omnitrophota bacterium]
FHQVALEKGLIPDDIPKNKESVRDYLRQTDKEDIWTEMQGYVYGARMFDVPAFPGALDCIARLRKNGIPVFIISHKTRYPYKGETYDLHASAREWLEANGLLESGPIGISFKDVFLKETKQEKLLQIGACGCTHFIDDLPEFLADPAFPKNTKKLLFSPTRKESPSLNKDVMSFKSWQEIAQFLLAQ